MDKIANYNCEGMCVEEFCGAAPTHFTKKNINGISIFLSLCEEHSNQYEASSYKSFKKIGESS